MPPSGRRPREDVDTPALGPCASVVKSGWYISSAVGESLAFNILEILETEFGGPWVKDKYDERHLAAMV